MRSTPSVAALVPAAFKTAEHEQAGVGRGEEDFSQRRTNRESDYLGGRLQRTDVAWHDLI